MKVEIVNDDKKYISKVSCNNNMLTWISSSEDIYFLIIKSEYDKKLNLADEVKKELEKLKSVRTSEIVKLSPNVSVYLYKKTNLIGYKCTVMPARYSIYICDFNFNSQELTIYYQDKYKTYFDLSDMLRFKVHEIAEQQSGGFFSRFMRRNDDSRKCVFVNLEGDCPVGYSDGSLYYTFEGTDFEYPITKDMLKNGFFVPVYKDKLPDIKSYFNGFIGITTIV